MSTEPRLPHATEFQRAELGNKEATVLDPMEIRENIREHACHNIEEEFQELMQRGPDLMSETSHCHRHLVEQQTALPACRSHH